MWAAGVGVVLMLAVVGHCDVPPPPHVVQIVIRKDAALMGRLERLRSGDASVWSEVEDEWRPKGVGENDWERMRRVLENVLEQEAIVRRLELMPLGDDLVITWTPPPDLPPPSAPVGVHVETVPLPAAPAAATRVPLRKLTHADYPCQPKQVVSVSRLLSVAFHGFWVRNLPPPTPAYTLSYWALLLPFDTNEWWRAMHVFGASHAVLCNGRQLRIICSSGLLMEAEQTFDLPHDLVEQWSHWRTVVTGSRVQVLVDGNFSASFECNPVFPFVNSVLGPSASLSEKHPTRAFFANVRYRNFEEIASVENRPALSVPKVRWNDEPFDESFLDLVGSTLPEAFRNNGRAAAGGSDRAMTNLAVLYSLGFGGIRRSDALARVWHLLSIAYAGDEEGVGSPAALANDAALGYATRMHYRHVAARVAFDILSSEHFRQHDYTPIEDVISAEDPLHQRGKAEADDEVVEEWRYSAEGGDVDSLVNLGDIHYHGLRNMPVNVGRAAEMFERAAALGDDRAQLQLAKMHFMGDRRFPSNATLKTVLEGLNDTSEGVALAANCYAAGVPPFPRDDARALELFRVAAAMPDATAVTIGNLGVMERNLGNLDAAVRYFEVGAARDDIASAYWLGDTLLMDTMFSAQNASIANMHFHAVIRRYALRFVWPDALDCFVAKNMRCALSNYRLAGLIGLAEASWDLATVLQRRLDMDFVKARHREDLIRNLFAEALSTFHPMADLRRDEVLLQVARTTTNETDSLRMYAASALLNNTDAMFTVAHYHAVNGSATEALALAARLAESGELPELVGAVVVAFLVHSWLALVAAAVFAILLVVALWP